MSDTPALSVKGLTKVFSGRVRALDDVSFDVPQASLYGLLGPNGAGKTTLFSVAANFLQATSGEVEVLGISVKQISKLRGRFSMLPQDALFERNIPILEQIIMFCLLNGQSREQAKRSAEEALQVVGLSEAMKRSAHALSHGMSKRLALAQAFLGSPEVVLLDEPTSGLDPQNAANIRKIIREMAGTRTVVISSHNLNEIQEMCTHCAILDEGKLVSSGPMAELLGTEQTVEFSYSKPVTKELIDRVLTVKAISMADQTGPMQLRLQFDLADGITRDDVIGEVLKVSSEVAFIPRTINEGSRLEERFLEITGGTGDSLGST